MTTPESDRFRMPGNSVWLSTFMLLLPCLLCGVSSRVAAQDVPHGAGEAGLGHWMTGAPAPTARTEVAVAVLDGLIYVIGGFERPNSWKIWQSSVSTKVEAYDPTTNRWSSKPDLPTGLHHAGAAVLAGALYVVGGFTVSDDTLWNPSDRVFRFDPAGGTPAPALQSGRTPAAHIGSIMALLATFHEAGVLPPEFSREADRLIHTLIQSQSMFLKSADPVVRNVFSSALSEKFNAKKAVSLTQAFDSQGWTSETLEALVDYSAQRSPADETPLAESFRDYNVSPTDWKFVRQVFAKARERFLKQGKQVHEVFAAQRAAMPGARQTP